MSSVIIHPKVEPGVIDNKMLEKCVLEQGPRGEAGRLFAEEGVHLNEVTVIRLEFLNIIRIDHLWMLDSLRVLSLNHNYIEKLENLDQLTGLVELDVSFNSISIVEGINTLVNLEILVLSYNKIQKLENLDELKKLVVLGFAGNAVTDYKEVICLRPFKDLRSLSFKGNPCMENHKARTFIKAALPQVTHLDYTLIDETDRENCIEEFYADISKLNDIDRVKEEAHQKQQAYEDQVNFHAKSFVDYLSGPELVINMFNTDPEGLLLLKAGLQVRTLHEEYITSYVAIMKRLVDFGLSQSSVREKEIEVFEEVVSEARDESANRSKEVVAVYVEEKEELMDSLLNFIDAVLSEVSTVTDVRDSIFALCDRFKAAVKQMFMGLMKEEMSLFDQCEDTRVQYATNIKDLGNKMVEATRSCFRDWREKEEAWNLNLVEMFSEMTVQDVAIYDDTPRLLAMFKDKDYLTDTLAQSLDIHMRYIDDREDYILTRVAQWRDDLTNNTNINEIKRNRSRVLEISYYVESQHKEWKETVELMFEGSLPPDFEEVLVEKEAEEEKPAVKKREESFDDEED